MTAEEKLNKIRLHVYTEIKHYKALWEHDLKGKRKEDMAMDLEATRVLNKIKILIEED